MEGSQAPECLGHYQVDLRQREQFTVERLEFEGVRVVPDEHRVERVDGRLAVTSLISCDHEQHTALQRLLAVSPQELPTPTTDAGGSMGSMASSATLTQMYALLQISPSKPVQSRDHNQMILLHRTK
jgi:hypothetical protein